MASLIFTCIYALMGVALLGMVLGVLGNNLIEKHDVLLKEFEAENLTYITQFLLCHLRITAYAQTTGNEVVP